MKTKKLRKIQTYPIEYGKETLLTCPCRECGDAADDGEGWNGLCGGCADIAALKVKIESDIEFLVTEYAYDVGIKRKERKKIEIVVRCVVNYAHENADFRKGLSKILEDLE